MMVVVSISKGGEESGGRVSEFAGEVECAIVTHWHEDLPLRADKSS